jgi:hypothetical protein
MVGSVKEAFEMAQRAFYGWGRYALRRRPCEVREIIC